VKVIKQIILITTIVLTLFLITNAPKAEAAYRRPQTKRIITHYKRQPVNLQAKFDSCLTTSDPQKQQIIQSINSIFGATARNALKIACFESGMTTTVVHVNSDRYRSHDVGIFQVNCFWHRDIPNCENTMKDINANVQKAYAMSHGGIVWRAWATARYLPLAQ